MMKEAVVEMQSLGLRLLDRSTNRRGGAGPAEGIAVQMGKRSFNVPVGAHYVAGSPYLLKTSDKGSLLFKNNTELFPVQVIPEPKFYGMKTGQGIDLKRIALLHGKDCLATTVIQKCTHWNTSERCKFCGIELSLNDGRTLALKTPEQLAEVAEKALKYDGVKHVVLTSGSGTSSIKVIRYLSECTCAIKRAADLPVHVQIEPPENPDELGELKAAGLDTIGIHIENFDPDILSEIAPVKARFGIKRYERAWKKSVELFGANQVSSFMITGLGESRHATMEGARYLAGMGVYPFVVPFRPIPGTPLGDSRVPPAPDFMKGLYEEISRVLEKNDLSSQKSRAGCVRCGACSAISEFEKWEK